MDFKALTTNFQLLLIYLKLTNQLSWHWLTILAPLVIVVGTAFIWTAGELILDSIKRIKEKNYHG